MSTTRSQDKASQSYSPEELKKMVDALSFHTKEMANLLYLKTFQYANSMHLTVSQHFRVAIVFLGAVAKGWDRINHNIYENNKVVMQAVY